MGLLRPTATNETEDEELTSTRRLVAIHESGHVAGCNEYNIPYGEIHVSVNRAYWTGKLEYKGFVHTADNYKGQEMSYAAMCLAGKEAEALYLMEKQGWRKGKAHSFAEDHAGADLRNAEFLVGRRGLYDAERRARRLVESSWGSITWLAGQL